ncbi:1307_t:CDS:1, partial [Racocetra persica]
EKRKWFIDGLKPEYRLKVKEHFPADYNKARNLAIKIERYNKDNQFDIQKTNKTLIERGYNNTKFGIDELMNAMEALKISQIKKKPNNDIQ